MTLTPLKEKPENIMRELVKNAKKQFKDRLLLVGAKGSLARNEFTPYSDFDLVIIVDDEKLEQWSEFMYNTTYFDIQIISLKNVLKKISTVKFYWPAEVGGKLNLKIYYDNKNTFERLKKEYKTIAKNKKMFEGVVNLNTIIEYFSKSIRYYENREFVNLRWACLTLFEEFSMVLGLLNQRYFIQQGPTAKIKEISKFKYLPVGWKVISQNLVSENPEKNIAGAKQLMRLLDELSKKHSFTNYKIYSIQDIKFKI